MAISDRTLQIVASLLLPALTSLVAWAEPPTEPVPTIHASDLFRPHNDPDDHWDLACIYSLAYQNEVDLLGILIDDPQPGRYNDPDVMAVAQLNYLTGEAVPVMVGSPQWHDSPGSISAELEKDLSGIRSMLEIMRRSPEPVVIHVLGSCRDLAMAGRLAPDLFAEKCRAIYLNAGSGTPDPAKAERLEWNVHLEPQAYVAMFELPCPLYWMPCFEEVHPHTRDLFRVAEYGTFYRFRQGEILPHLSPGMQRYFLSMFRDGRFFEEERDASALQADWLRELRRPIDSKAMQSIEAMQRNMWCTAGFLHSVGKTVTPDGKIVPLGKAESPVYSFDSIEVTCNENAVTSWKSTSEKTDRYRFHVRNLERYPEAMTRAMRTLLEQLP
jgi:hypothetical protein